MRAKFVNEDVSGLLKPKSEKEIDEKYQELFLQKNKVTIEEAENIVKELRKFNIDAKLYKRPPHVSDSPIEIIPYKILDGINVIIECPTEKGAKQIYLCILNNNAFVRHNKLKIEKSSSSFGNSYSIKKAKELLSRLKYNINIFDTGKFISDDEKYWTSEYFEWKDKQRKKSKE